MAAPEREGGPRCGYNAVYLRCGRRQLTGAARNDRHLAGGGVREAMAALNAPNDRGRRTPLMRCVERAGGHKFGTNAPLTRAILIPRHQIRCGISRFNALARGHGSAFTSSAGAHAPLDNTWRQQNRLPIHCVHGELV